MSKILKNTTASPIIISDTGITLPASPATYTIPYQDYLIWGASSNIVAHVGTGAVIVNDGSQDLSASDGMSLLKGFYPHQIIGATTGTPIGNTGDRLKVDTVITPTEGSIPSTNHNLRYDDMNASTGGVARGTIVPITGWTQVYSYTGTGIVFSFLLNIEEKSSWRVRLVVDGHEIFGSNGMLMGDLVSDTAYDLDDAGSPLSSNEGNFGLSLEEHDRFVWNCPNSFPIRFDTSVQLLVQRISTTKKFQAGLIILTKET